MLLGHLIVTHNPYVMVQFQKVHRHPIVDGTTVGLDLILVQLPSIDLHCGILPVQEPVLFETLQSNTAVN